MIEELKLFGSLAAAFDDTHNNVKEKDTVQMMRRKVNLLKQTLDEPWNATLRMFGEARDDDQFL